MRPLIGQFNPGLQRLYWFACSVISEGISHNRAEFSYNLGEQAVVLHMQFNTFEPTVDR
jgi:hypothetical protein